MKRAKGLKLEAVEHITEDMQAVPTLPTESVKVIEPIKPTGRKAETQTDGLIIENAILKERIALLNEEIEKLRTALTSLM